MAHLNLKHRSQLLRRINHQGSILNILQLLLPKGDKSGPNTKIEEELVRYPAEQHEKDEADDPVDVWVSAENQFPTLSLIAHDILVIPASSAHVEIVFSMSGESCIGKRNRLSGKNPEQEVLLKRNKKLLYKAYAIFVFTQNQN